MGRFVIVAYTPKPGMEKELLAVVEKHIEVLVAERLVTDRSAYVMRAMDGTMVEVFEWRSAAAIDQAHNSQAVQDLWGEFEAVCEFKPLAQLQESQAMFAEFDAVEFDAT